MLKNLKIKNNALMIGGVRAEELVKKYGSPLYVYDGAVIRQRFRSLQNLIAYPQLDLHYACKANTNPEIMKLLRSEGAYVETVSPGEIMIARIAGFQTNEIIFTSSNISNDEMKFIIDEGITMNLDSLTQIRRYGELQPNSKISIRLNQGIGAGHHKTNITGGPDSKFGIDLELLPEVNKLCKKYNLTISNIHQHIGSGILDEAIFMKAMEKLLETAMQFPDLEYLDFGGGFGVPYKEEDVPLNMESLGAKIGERLHRFMNEYGRMLTVRFEPGRYLVAESGVLLAHVVDIKQTPYKKFVGINTGFNHLVRPMMYGSHHQIVNASCVNGNKEVVSIAGDICESGDLFATERNITKFKEDDIAAIFNVGAYGYTMASHYSSRAKPAEVLVENGKDRLIRERSPMYISIE